MKSGNLNFLEPSGPVQSCSGTDLPLPLIRSLDVENIAEHMTVVIGQTGSMCSDGHTDGYPSAGYIFRTLLTSISINH